MDQCQTYVIMYHMVGLGPAGFIPTHVLFYVIGINVAVFCMRGPELACSEPGHVVIC